MPTVQTIVFDLGVVLIDLDQAAARSAFQQLNQNPDLQAEELLKDPIFRAIELGLATEEELFETLRRALHVAGPDQALRDAWNAMLLTIPAKRITMLRELAEHYPIYLLSNTNDTHLEYIQAHVQNTHQLAGLEELFVETFYSQKLHLRKPDTAIYAEVTRLAKLQPEETLFIDDNEDNVAAARTFGWQALHLAPGEEVIEKLEQALSGVLPIAS